MDTAGPCARWQPDNLEPRPPSRLHLTQLGPNCWAVKHSPSATQDISFELEGRPAEFVCGPGRTSAIAARCARLAGL